MTCYSSVTLSLCFHTVPGEKPALLLQVFLFAILQGEGSTADFFVGSWWPFVAISFSFLHFFFQLLEKRVSFDPATRNDLTLDESTCTMPFFSSRVGEKGRTFLRFRGKRKK